VFDWWDFLGVAERLSQTADEADRRTSVSRAYYAAFGAALEWRQGCRYFGARRDGTDHERLWEEFRESDDDDEREVGELGYRLRRRRNLADYHARIDGLGDMVDDSLDDARELRTLLGALPC